MVLSIDNYRKLSNKYSTGFTVRLRVFMRFRVSFRVGLGLYVVFMVRDMIQLWCRVRGRVNG